MRDLLTGLAIILIVALTTMLVAPYFVDWNGQRAFLENQLTRALGQKVTIGGNIDLKLLPTPYLRLNQTVIGSDDGAIKVGIRYLDLELAVAPLLHGEFDIVEGQLDEPIIRLTLQPDRTLPALPDTPAFRASVRLERIGVVDGSLAITDPESGRTFVVDHLDFRTEAPSLAGPFRGNGSAGPASSRTKFRFSTTEARQGKTHLHLSLDETASHPGVDLDGEMVLDRRGDTIRESFDGTIAANGHLAPGEGTPVAWRLSGPLAADPQRAVLGDGELRIGGVADDGLALKANVEGSFGDGAATKPNIVAKFEAKQLDIDRLSGAPVNAERPPPPHLPSPANLRKLLAAATPPIPTSVEVSVDTALWGGETLSGLKASAALAGPAPHAMSVAGDGPGGLHLDLHGTVTDRGGVDGRLEVAADDLPAALRWLGTVAPDLNTPASAPVRSVALTADMKAENDGIAFDKLALTADRSDLTGSASVTLGPSPKLSADLRTTMLDLDAPPDLRDLGAGTAAINLKLDAGALRIARVGDGALAAGHLRIDLDAAGQHVAVNDFEVDDLGGATIKAKGNVDDHGAALSMTIAAARLDKLAGLVRQLAPGRISDALAGRASALAPANLGVTAAFKEDGGRLVPSRVDATGSLATTRFGVHLAPDPNGHGITLAAKADTAQGGTLLRQLGVSTIPIELIGASRINVTASGPSDQPLTTKIDASFGASHFAASGRYDLFAAGHPGTGTLTVSTPDALPLLQTLALAPLDATDRLPAQATGAAAVDEHGVALTGLKGQIAGIGVGGALHWQPATGDQPALTGSLDVDRLALGSLFALALGPEKPPASGAAWSSEPFAGALVDPPRSAVALHAKTLDLGFGFTGQDATMTLGTDRGLVSVTHGAAAFGGGHIGYDVTLRRDGAQAALEGSLSAKGARIDLPAIKAVLTGKLDLAGSGRSASALVASLAGTGEATLDDTVLSDVNARALPDVFAEVESDALAVDEETIRRAFEDNGNGSVAAGTQRFGASLAGGSLSLTPQGGPISAGPVAITLDGDLDLRRARSKVQLVEQLRSLPKDWTGPPPTITLTDNMQPGARARSFDVSNFINAVAARAIARESARIEAYEFDVRERAVFNARLQADRRREQDRLKAEADVKAAADAARKADADRRAKSEAARLEKLRAAQSPPDDAAAQSAPQGADRPGPRPKFDAPAPGTATDPSAAGRY